MKVTPAARHNQRRASQPLETCDNCVGLTLQGDAPLVGTDPSSAVTRWVVWIPEIGSQLFWLHAECADYLRQPVGEE